jgi:glutamate transport system permease protein
MLPAIISQCVVALKDTALGVFVLAPGLTAVARSIYLEFNNRVPTMIVTASLYIAVNIVLTVIATWVQKKYVGEKEVLEVPMIGAATAQGMEGGGGGI